MSNRVRIVLSLSLTGRYAAMGRQAEAALRMLVDERNAAGGVYLAGARRPLELELFDDRSDPNECARIYRAVCAERRADLLLGPYSSELTRVAARISDAAGYTLVNHGGAGDDLYQQGYRLLVGVLSPASEYFKGLARMLATLKFRRKRVAVITAPSPFARAVTDGFEMACREGAMRRHGIRVLLRRVLDERGSATLGEVLRQLRQGRINAVVSAGSFEEDIALVRAVTEADLNVPVLACVAAGVSDFGERMGEASDGIIGASQWEREAPCAAELGPSAEEFARRFEHRNPDLRCDYPAAQAYAAALLACTALELAGSTNQEELRAAFGNLRTSTLYGDFAIDSTGRQRTHRMCMVQWHQGRRVIIDPDAHSIYLGKPQLPHGLRLLLASLGGARFGYLARK